MASHLQILQPFHVWYWWNLHANLIDFDHSMDNFACDGSHDEEHLEVVKTLTSEVNKKLIVQTSELIVLR